MMRLLILALLCGCTTPEGEKNRDKGPQEEVDDGWPNHTFTAFAVDETLDARIGGCSTRLAYQTWDYDGEAEITLVLTPGRTEYTDKYHHIVKLIDDKDLPWNIVIWDPYGQGRSGGVRAHQSNWDAQNVCDLDTIIDLLVDPGIPLALASHSMGGLITMRWLEQNPGQVVAAVFSAPMLRLYFEGVTESEVCIVAAGGIPTVPSDPFEQRVECEDPTQNLTHDCEQYELFYRDPITEIGSQTWGWLNAACSALKDMRIDAPEVRDDLLILQAGLDTLVSNDGQDEMCDLINDNNGFCQISSYPNDFHEIFQEVDRALAVNEMVDFIGERIP